MTLLAAARIVRTLGLASDVRWMMSRYHFGTSAAEVAQDWRNRCALAFNGKRKLGPDAVRLGAETCTAAVVTYAVAVHAHNGRSYRRTMRGGR
jgi:hypothetical protein